jgi:hypothetical protein
MTDAEFLPPGGRKLFRRKRRYQGATWAPPSMSAEVEDGLWCKRCKKRHGYMTMLIAYEKVAEKWVTYWMCPVDGRTLNPNG